MNENENTTYQILWDAMKIVPRGKFIAVFAYILKEERLQINNLTLHLKECEKQEQTKSKASRKKKIIQVAVKISEVKNRKTIKSTKPEVGSLK